MSKRINISIEANPDSDDCLAQAQEVVQKALGLKGWDLDPQWDSDDVRERVHMQVPNSVGSIPDWIRIED